MNQAEFAIQVNKASEKLFVHALKFTKDEDDAKDLVQDTLVKAIRFSHRFESNTNLKSWLYVIMRNTFVNDYRNKKRKDNLITTAEDITYNHLLNSASTNSSITSFALTDISKALNSIPESYRVPFTLYFEGYKYEEIAEKLDIPIGTVKTRIHEARIRLKKYLKVHKP
ncbi:sigma-70 family RNA polymerase sigma factor [Pedobacter aquatilis]|uniref:RNA polymerase sigma factor n=1 Tax=Pedobacter aquatilis TaxID=351343 RepID=UPI0025B5B891|nr:sigma-70 family RNA polymerase sigma factor [Pedobacter aquatilis]MDN3588796.1 sigma-70 family RNA polymerase sigma factor [Pedobacter aquatilis]